MHYLLPIKAGAAQDLGELADYLRWLGGQLPVIVVDGSPEEVFARNAVLFRGVTHLRPDAGLASRCRNGKVAGVLTGFARCASDTVVVADDDVRYSRTALDRMQRLLETAELVVPQNFYAPLPWQARWDTGRMLVNRALPAGDYPGTLGVRLTERLRALGYDGDVLFENLELIRSVRADGGRVVVARDLFVRRLPPTSDHFIGQRLRQAYDSLAQPARLVVELALLPALLWTGRRRRRLLVALALPLAAAELGRRRAGGTAYFPPSTALFAPLWVLERAGCSWIAVARRLLLGGTDYSGVRLTRAATSERRLRRNRGRTCDCCRRTA